MQVDDWVERLRARFAELHAKRGEEAPVYAIEHGLNQAERDQLRLDLLDEVPYGVPRDSHWLAWVVYATERGYEFSGDEYWPTFAETTPGWADGGGARLQLRTFFERFRDKYGGVEPKGTWATWRSNIVWPLTNAIVPRDLQPLLLDTFVKFTRQGFTWATPEQVGRAVAAYAYAGSDRFRQFIQQHELIGQFLFGLQRLDANEEPLIDAGTLRRICDDIATAVPQGREILKDVLVRIAAGGKHRAAPERHARPAATAAAGEGEAKVQPWLGVKASASPEHRWILIMSIPSLASLAGRSAELGKALKLRYAEVDGARGLPPIAPGAVLDAETDALLAEWPKGVTQPITLRRADSGVQQDLGSGLSRTGVPALGRAYAFPIDDSGRGWLQLKPVLKPGGDYVIASPSKLPAGISTTTCRATGAHWGRLNLPAVVSQDLRDQLTELGFKVAVSAEVVAVGLPSVPNSDGKPVWIEGETPSFAVGGDHHMIDVRVIRETPAEVLPIGEIAAGARKFFSIEGAGLGQHRLLMDFAIASNGQRIQVPLEFAIKAKPSPTTDQALARVLQVRVSPPGSSLEEFWSGSARVEVMAPFGMDVRCSITMAASGGKHAKTNAFSAKAPMSPEQFFNEFKRTTRPKFEADIDLFATASLTVEAKRRGETLGTSTHLFERQSQALRWRVVASRQRRAAQLVNDTGDESPARRSFASFTTPWKLEAEHAVEGAVTAGDDDRLGLFGAEVGGTSAWVVIEEEGIAPPGLTVPADVGWADLIVSSARWREAKLVGSGFERQKVIACLMSAIWDRVGISKQWRTRISEERGRGASAEELRTLVVDPKAWIFERAFADAVVKEVMAESAPDLERGAFRRAVATLVSMDADLRTAMAAVSVKDTLDGKEVYRTVTAPILADFARAVALDCDSAVRFAGPLLEPLRKILVKKPHILKAALLFASTNHGTTQGAN